MPFSTFFNNPFTTFSTNYSSSFSSIDSTYSASSAGSSPPYSPTQQFGGEVSDAAMYPLNPVTASRPVTGTISTLLDTQPRPTLISNRNAAAPPKAHPRSAHTPATRSLTKFLPIFAAAPSITSSGASTPRHGRSRSAGEVLHESSAARSRDPSQSLSRREREQEQERWKRKRIEGTHKVVQDLRELSKKEGFHISEEAFNDIIHAAGDTRYKSRQDIPRITPEMILGDDTGPYAADRAAGRRSSVLTPHDLSGKSPLFYCWRPAFSRCFIVTHCFLIYYMPNFLLFASSAIQSQTSCDAVIYGWAIEVSTLHFRVGRCPFLHQECRPHPPLTPTT